VRSQNPKPSFQAQNRLEQISYLPYYNERENFRILTRKDEGDDEEVEDNEGFK
jgi:hypothetical protein